MDSYFVYVLKMEYGFILHLCAQNGIWIHDCFTCLKWNMDSYFVYVLKMEYGFILHLRAQNGIWIHIA